MKDKSNNQNIISEIKKLAKSLKTGFKKTERSPKTRDFKGRGKD